MKIIQDEKIVKLDDNFGVCLGNFDGIHLAHKKLIKTLTLECEKMNIKSMVYTFNKHPFNILGNKEIKLITTMEKKSEILEQLKVDYLCLREFDDDFSNIKAEDFIKNILVNKYNVKLVIVGFNYNFGYKGLGDVNLLNILGEKYDFKVIMLEPMYFKDEVISSSNIREKIKNGDMEGSKNLLGKYYSIKGKVEYGNRIGTEIGFPTANIIPLKNYALPKSGVYYTNTIIDNKCYESITNIGNNPTIAKGHNTIIETHIFEFSGWLYGKNIEVVFKRFIRDEVKHKDIHDLKETIINDINYVKKIYGGQ